MKRYIEEKKRESKRLQTSRGEAKQEEKYSEW